MMDLSLAVLDLHEQGYCIRTLTASNILIKNRVDDGFELIFTQVKDFVQVGDNRFLTSKPTSNYCYIQIVEYGQHLKFKRVDLTHSLAILGALDSYSIKSFLESKSISKFQEKMKMKDIEIFPMVLPYGLETSYQKC